MKIAIMDSNYSRPEHIGLAASWLRWEIEKTKHELVLPTHAEIVFVTASSQQAVADVRRCLKKIDRTKSVFTLAVAVVTPRQYLMEWLMRSAVVRESVLSEPYCLATALPGCQKHGYQENNGRLSLRRISRGTARR